MQQQVQRLLWAAALLRGLLLLFGEVQDRCMRVKYTDVDYQVFTDAARFVAQDGSPYERSTYRYSPLLAYILLPNIWVTRSFGKVLFSVCDIIAGWLIARIVRLQGASPQATTIATAVWLFNPWTFTISTRGSCDVLVVVLLLSMLLCLHKGANALAAVTYGLAVHLRIYPIIYAPAIVLFLAARAVRLRQPFRAGSAGKVSLRSKLVQIVIQGLHFGLLSGSLFVGLHFLFSNMYGDMYTQEAFLHHLTRKDHRHNFSIYYYSIYLTYDGLDGSGAAPTAPSTPSAEAALAFLHSLLSKPKGRLLHEAMPGLLGMDLSRLLQQPARMAFLPQILILVAMSLKLHEDLPLGCLLQTLCFVAFNKVCTAQYFVWWMCLMPLVMPRISWPLPPSLLRAATFWAAMQLHWLAWAYLLEFQGQPVHLGIWFASLLFLVSNVMLVVQLLRHVDKSNSFLTRSLFALKGSGSIGETPDIGNEDVDRGKQKPKQL
ncbi:Dol-P-Man alpha-1,4-mannosyltransferase-like protein [Dunaliella salina]|uniref:GPI mannosyltransferase 1 n=1 Tax=Dunaliella salina TaxID=3046 RepID=A0ABQ7G6K8_DUNSA|nr:Dol-P-Man alpha-1,4-mannosyltransferase-like protein [Dunaliella salina]|eukprot:KAF5830243.1 Dol-P-Man alpha-1,4-mannosyltransferase-like protein [Dunaliella salina]